MTHKERMRLRKEKRSRDVVGFTPVNNSRISAKVEHVRLSLKIANARERDQAVLDGKTPPQPLSDAQANADAWDAVSQTLRKGNKF